MHLHLFRLLQTLQRIGRQRLKMSQYEELVQIVGDISGDSESKSYEFLQYAESLGRFVASFSAIVNGTNDVSAKIVCNSFVAAQKDLYKAAKASLEAAKTGYDWCGGAAPQLVLKKVKR